MSGELEFAGEIHHPGHLCRGQVLSELWQSSGGMGWGWGDNGREAAGPDGTWGRLLKN
jgi:hypothetical protein